MFELSKKTQEGTFDNGCVWRFGEKKTRVKFLFHFCGFEEDSLHHMKPFKDIKSYRSGILSVNRSKSQLE